MWNFGFKSKTFKEQLGMSESFFFFSDEKAFPAQFVDFLSSIQDIHTPEQPHWGFAANTENSGKRGHLLGQFRKGIVGHFFLY